MASHLILDRKDPSIAELVADWVDGETYDLRVKVTQESSGENTTRFVVDEVVHEPSEEEPEEAPPTVKPKASKPSVVIPKY